MPIKIGAMKFLPLFAALFAAGLLLPSTILPAGKKKSTPASALDTSDRITALHLTSITVTLFANHQSKEYQVTPATKVTVNGQPSQFSGLATGMDVTVTSADGITAAGIDAKTPRR